MIIFLDVERYSSKINEEKASKRNFKYHGFILSRFDKTSYLNKTELCSMV